MGIICPMHHVGDDTPSSSARIRTQACDRYVHVRTHRAEVVELKLSSPGDVLMYKRADVSCQKRVGQCRDADARHIRLDVLHFTVVLVLHTHRERQAESTILEYTGM